MEYLSNDGHFSSKFGANSFCIVTLNCFQILHTKFGIRECQVTITGPSSSAAEIGRVRINLVFMCYYHLKKTDITVSFQQTS